MTSRKKQQQEEVKEPRLTTEEMMELNSMQRRLAEIQSELGALEIRKHGLIEEFKRLVEHRAFLWSRIAQKYGLDPRKQYTIEPDGRIVEVKSG